MSEFEYYFRLPKAERERINLAIKVLMRAGLTFEHASSVLLSEGARVARYTHRFPVAERG